MVIRMEASKGAREDDMGDGMQCSDHPYRNNPGGICAFCLQDKLGKLVSSSFPLPIAPSSLSSSSPSFRSHTPPSVSSALPSSSLTTTNGTSSTNSNTHYRRLPFLLAKKKKKKASAISSSSSAASTSDIIFKRSKSTATPRRGKLLNDDGIVINDEFSPRKRNGFWSFLYLSSSKSSAYARKLDTVNNNNNSPNLISGNKHKEKCLGGSSLARKFEIGVVEDATDNTLTSASASASSFDRKVSRSRSVGCGSRSFSGDFFERISTGFGDCTLRRVESQREGKPKAVAAAVAAVNHHHHQCMKERVKCAGIFSGFMMTASSSSSSSSSSYWVSSSSGGGGDDHHHHMNGKSGAVAISHNGRGRNWGWAFASPMRAFGAKPNSSKENNKRDIIANASSDHNDATTTPPPNLSDIPSLLAIRV